MHNNPICCSTRFHALVVIKTLLSTLLILFTLLGSLSLWAETALPPLIATGEPVSEYPELPPTLANAIQDRSPFKFVTFNADGTVLATLSNDNNVQLWDMQKRQMIYSFKKTGMRISSIAFSSTESHILALAIHESADIILWSVKHQTVIYTAATQQSTIHTIAFSPNGKIFASACKDGFIKLWDVKTKPYSSIKSWDVRDKYLLPISGISVIKAHRKTINAIVFSPDGKILASAAEESAIKLWDIQAQKQKPIAILKRHGGSVKSLAFSPNSEMLASASSDKTIKLWKINTPSTKKLLHTFKGHSDSVNSVAFSPNGNILASASSDKTVRLWNIQIQQPLTSDTSILEAHEGKVQSVAFSPLYVDGKMLVSASSDQTIQLWDTHNKQRMSQLSNHKSWVTSIAFSPDNKMLAAAAYDHSIKLWDLSKKQLIHHFTAHKGSVRAIIFSPDGRYFASAADDQTVKLWDAHNKTLLYSFTGHSGSVRAIVFSPNGKVLASAADDKTVRLWDVSTKSRLHVFEAHTDGINAIAFSPDGTLFASASRDKTIKLWNIQQKKIAYAYAYTLIGHTEKINAISFSDNGKMLASADDEGSVKLWDVQNVQGDEKRSKKRLLYSFSAEKYNGKATSVAFNTLDGNDIIAAAFNDGTITMWNRQNQQPIRSVKEHRNKVSSIIFSSDQQTFASASADGSIKLWDAQTHRVNHELIGGAQGNWLWQEKKAGKTVIFWRGDNGTLLLQIDIEGYKSIPPYKMATSDSIRITLPKKIITLGSGVTTQLLLDIENLSDQPVWWINSTQPYNSPYTFYPAQVYHLRAKEKNQLSIPISLNVPPPKPFKGRLTLKLITAADSHFPVSMPVIVGTSEGRGWLYLLLIVLLLLVAIAIFYLRRYRHPLLLQLSADPQAIYHLVPEQLAEAQRRLLQTGRLRQLLANAEIGKATLSDAIAFATREKNPEYTQTLPQEQLEEDRDMPPQSSIKALHQAKWLARRLGCVPIPLDNGLFRIKLTADFPLNVEQCLFYFPSDSMDALDALQQLKSIPESTHIMTLIISNHSRDQRKLHSKTLDVGNKWVAPDATAVTKLLLHPDPEMVLAKIMAEHIQLAQISPYKLGGGTEREAMFFGRREMIDHIMNREPTNYLLVAGRQLGKSTLLKALQRRYKDHAHVRCFYHALANEKLIPQLARSLKLPVHSTLADIIDVIEQNQSQHTYLFLLDEADVFIHNERQQGYKILNTLRQLSEAGHCFFILAGFWHLYDYSVLDYQSPLQNFGEIMQLGALETKACRQLITEPMAKMGLSYATDALVNELLQQTGQRANLISIACNEILRKIDNTQRIINADNVKSALSSDSITRAFEGWKTLSGISADDRIDRVIVYAMIRQEQFTLSELVAVLTEKGFKIPVKCLERSFARLILAFILHDNGKYYTWRVPLFCKHLRRQELGVRLQGEL